MNICGVEWTGRGKTGETYPKMGLVLETCRAVHDDDGSVRWQKEVC